MRIFGMILAIVGAAIIVFFGMRTTDTGAAADPAFVVALAFGGPLAALGLLIVAIRKPKKKTPEGGA